MNRGLVVKMSCKLVNMPGLPVSQMDRAACADF